MTQALVFESDLPLLSDAAGASPLPTTSLLAGLTLTRRVLMLAWRAGAEQALLVARSAESAAAWSRSLRDLPIPLRIECEDSVRLSPDPADRLLVLSPLVMPGPGLLERLLEISREGSAAAGGPGAPCAGPAVLSSAELARLADGTCPARAVRELLFQPGSPVRRLGWGEWTHLSSAGELESADRALYRGLTSITDGYIDRVFNRRISGWVTRRLIRLPVTPNHVTWFHLALGLLAAWLFAQGTYLAGAVGAVLFQLSVALDCTDGEIARLKFQFSRFGSRLDVAADNVVNIALFAAISRAAVDRLGPQTAAALGILAVTGVLMCVLVVYSLARLQARLRPGEASPLAVTNRLSAEDQASAGPGSTLVDRVVNEATSRDFSVIVVACALLGRLEWFAWLAGIGSHLFWMLFGCLQLGMLRRGHGRA